MQNINYLGYYAMDKDRNLFQFKWQPNDDLHILKSDGKYDKVKKSNYEIVSIEIVTDEYEIKKGINKVSKKDVMNAIEYFFTEGFIEQMKYDERYYITALLNQVANDYNIKLVEENK